MEEIEKGILSRLLKGDREIPLYDKLKPEMFSDPTRRKLFELLREKDYDYYEIKEKTGIKFSTLYDINQGFDIPFQIGSVQQFIDDHYLGSYKTDLLLIDDLEEAHGKLTEIMRERTPEERVEDVLEEYKKFEEMYADANDKGLLGISTGWTGIDRVTFGLIPGHIWIVGGYYGSGKSYFGINLANNVLNEGGSVAIFSTEMSRVEYNQRLVGLRGGLNLLEVFSAKLEGEKKEARDKARDEVVDYIKRGKLHIYGDQRNVTDIRSKVQKLKRTTGVNLVIIDYVQNLDKGTKYEDLAQTVNEIQHMTHDLGVTTLVVSQISNEAQKGGEDFQVDGFKGAGEIGQIANVAIRLFRKKDDDNNWTDDFRLAFVKVRHNYGRTLDFKINFPGGEIVDPLNKKGGKPATPQEVFDLFKGM